MTAERDERVEQELADKEQAALNELHSPVPQLVRCWCGTRDVYVAESNIARGLTATCGLPRCQRPKGT